MAEAAVEDRPHTKFYCHMCNVQFENASANFTCPHCSDGFIEELQEAPRGSDSVDVDDDVDTSDIEFEDDVVNPLTAADMERFMGRSNRPDDHRNSRYHAFNQSRMMRPRAQSRHLRQNVPFENLIQDFIVNLGVGLNWGAAGNMQLFLGNPGDYAWGREGLDAIVTQLLNQMDSTGPPPVSKEVIDALPMVSVGTEQVEQKLQCSVCWEDFQAGEPVRQLPCTHIYHEPCIRPWLELHGTCPICRQNLINDEQSGESGNREGGSVPSGAQDPLNAIRNLLQQPSSSVDRNQRTNSSSSDSSMM